MMKISNYHKKLCDNFVEIAKIFSKNMNPGYSLEIKIEICNLAQTAIDVIVEKT